MLSSYKKQEGYHLTYSVTDFYNDYAKEYPGKLTKQEFSKIVRGFLRELREEIIVNRYHFKMPAGLGAIRIQKRSNKGRLNAHRIDWKKTKTLNKKVYHLNLHSDRCYFRWHWEKPGSYVFKNKPYYSFVPVRLARRGLASRIKKCASDPNLRDYDCLS